MAADSESARRGRPGVPQGGAASDIRPPKPTHAHWPSGGSTECIAGPIVLLVTVKSTNHAENTPRTHACRVRGVILRHRLLIMATSLPTRTHQPREPLGSRYVFNDEIKISTIARPVYSQIPDIPLLPSHGPGAYWGVLGVLGVGRGRGTARTSHLGSQVLR